MTRKCLVTALVSLAIVVSIALLIVVSRQIRRSPTKEIADPRYERFMQLAGDGPETDALALGDSLFNGLREEKPGDPALTLLARRLEIAGRISTMVAGRVQSSQTVLLEGMTGTDDLGLPPMPVGHKAATDPALPPARRVYWDHLQAFAGEPVSDALTSQETAFCGRYYDLRMQEAIANIGRRIVVADPDSSEYVCYALVLPLLYLHGRDHAWGRVESLLTLLPPEMLDVLSMFVLLQTERPQAAMTLARYRARAAGHGLESPTRKDALEVPFSATVWAFKAADACVTNHRPDLAERVLCMLVTDLKERDALVELRLRIADGYARCRDYATAAETCAQLLTERPETSVYGTILIKYLGYLARDDGTEKVVAATAAALDDPRCRPYLAQVLYLRWWALRQRKELEETAQIAQRLLKEYPSHPCVAPVLLERATDALAHQEYGKCRELLRKLANEFPSTESARRAQDILSRLADSQVK